jgi:hypothetical protein
MVTGGVTGKMTAGGVGSAGKVGVGTDTGPINGPVAGATGNVAGTPSWPLSTWVS